MKKIIKYICLIGIFLLFPVSVNAIDIDSVDIDVYVDKTGDAHVTEKWVNPKANYGDSEFYKAYDDLGEMSITNYTVAYNNQVFEYKQDWDINESFEEKAYKNGLYYEDGKTELCFGISNYNSGTYTLTYTIENFIVKLNDADMIYFNFLPSGNNINNFHLKLYSDDKFKDTLPVWGFGKKNGTAYVYDGYVEINSEGKIDKDEYIVLLAQFDKDTFDSSHVINKDFNNYLEMAKKGSRTSISANPIIKIIKTLFELIFSNFIFIFFVIICIITAVKSKNKIGSYRYDFGKNERKLPKDINKIRDIPFNDIYKVYLYSTIYHLNYKKTDLLGAVLLRWLKEKKIFISKSTTKILRKEECKIVLSENFISDNEHEMKLHKMLFEASKDGVLESNEFEKWCKNNYSKILRWFDDILDYETEKLLEEGLLQKVASSSKVQVTDKFIEEACLVKGVKEFLLEFSRINEKEAIEVNLWDMYLIYAQIFGIADKVAKQFKKLYPNEIQAYNQEYGYGFDDILFINMISTSGMSTAISSRDKANSYSSGGGGFMSGGGGGGSFGGGGSMGSR